MTSMQKIDLSSARFDREISLLNPKLESFLKLPSTTEYTKTASAVIPELSNPVLGKFTGIFGILDSMSVNKRFYSKDFWTRVINSNKVQSDLSAGLMLGIFEHPETKKLFNDSGLMTVRHPANASHVVKRLWIEGNYVMGEAYILNTKLGRILATFLSAVSEDGSPLIELNVSARGYSQKDYFDQYGIDQMNPNDYVLQTFDVVRIPGVKGARIKMESEDSNTILVDGYDHDKDLISKCESLEMSESKYYKSLVKHEFNLINV